MLSELLAESSESRVALRLTLGDAVKRLWAYAKAHGLQDGRTLNCNSRMRRIFGTPSLSMFEVSGALSAHMTGAGSSSSSSSSSTTTPTSSSSSSDATGELVTLSPALTSLLRDLLDGNGGGSGQATVTKAAALRFVGKYISTRRLRDENDKRKIHCDAALAQIVGKDSFTIFEAKALLARHMSPARGSDGSGSGSGAGTRAVAEEESDEEDGDDGDEEEESEEEDDEYVDGDSDDGRDEESLNPASGRAGSLKGSSAAGVVAQKWQCQHCTLLNDVACASCSACALPRKGQVAELQGATEAAPLPAKTTIASTAGGAGGAASSDGSGGGGGEIQQSGDGSEPSHTAAVTSSSLKKKRKRPSLPSEFLCPITQDVMVDPVSTEDGHTYERSAIARWLSKKKTSPLTGAALKTTALVPNIVLRKLIEEHRTKGR